MVITFSKVWALQGFIYFAAEAAKQDWTINDYGQHIPLAGPILLHIAEEAEAHPRMTRVLKTVKPHF